MIFSPYTELKYSTGNSVRRPTVPVGVLEWIAHSPRLFCTLTANTSPNVFANKIIYVKSYRTFPKYCKSPSLPLSLQQARSLATRSPSRGLRFREGPRGSTPSPPLFRSTVVPSFTEEMQPARRKLMSPRLCIQRFTYYTRCT